MKKSAALFFTILSMTANTNQAGTYAGFNLGGNFVTIDKTLHYPLEITPTRTSNYQAVYTGFRAQLLGGYNLILNKLISLAIEGDLDFNVGNSQYTIEHFFLNNSAKAEEALKVGTSLFFLPSYHINQNIRFFAGPGISKTQFKVTSGDVTGGNIGVTGDFEQWLTGWGLKAGAAMCIQKNFELVLTYQYTRYNSTQWTSLEPLTLNFLNGEYQPTVNTIMLGITFA